MRYVRQAGSDPAFLLKALGEAAGELERGFYGIHERTLQQEAVDPDDGWCLLGIPFHVRETERGVQRQLETILASRRAEIPHVDFDDIPFREDFIEDDVEELLEEFHYLRRRTTYLLWDIDEHDWKRVGEHRYRGPMSVLQITRELYQHDLEHLWQSRRMMERLATGSTR